MCRRNASEMITWAQAHGKLSDQVRSRGVRLVAERTRDAIIRQKGMETSGPVLGQQQVTRAERFQGRHVSWSVPRWFTMKHSRKIPDS